MTTELTIFDSNGAVPAHIAAFLDENEGNIADRATVNSLSPQGKQWTMSIEGEKTLIQRRNSDGDVEPVSTIKVVILDYAKRRGRSYYPGSYDPDNVSAPTCWSEDGIKPHDSVAEKQASACDKCPQSVKGSKVNDQGKEVVACSQYRMLAVVPAANMALPPLRLKIAITSDFDKTGAAELSKQGWFAFQQYTDMLRARGVKHSAALVTKMKFDTNANYPKIIFSPDRWLEQAELATVVPLSKSEDVQKLITGSFTPDGADGKATPKDEPEESKAPVAKTETPQPDDDEDDIILPGSDAPAQQEKPAARRGRPPKADTPKAEEKTEVKVDTGEKSELNDLLAAWGD